MAYREQVFHPALPQPEVARGTLWITAKGRLVKDQIIPQREISEIGDRFLSVREAPDGPTNLLPIPATARPMLDAIRLVVAGDAGALANEFTLDLQPGGPGWRIGLASKNAEVSETQITLTGCGDGLQAIEIEQERGVRRIFTLNRLP